MPDTLCYLNGEYAAAARGQGLGARPRLHLRRRRLRGGAGLRPASCSASTSTWRGSARSLGKLRIDNPHEPRAVARALPEAHRRAGRARRRRRPAGLHPGDARRGAARPRHAAGHRADRVHDGQPDEAGQRPSSATRAWPASRARDFRWERGDIKSISLLGNVLARQMSADHGALETIMFRDGFLTEASAQQRLGRARGRACSGRRRASTCSRASATSCCSELCEEVRHRLQPAADRRGRGAAPPTSCCSARPPRRCCR